VIADLNVEPRDKGKSAVTPRYNSQLWKVANTNLGILSNSDCQIAKLNVYMLSISNCRFECRAP